MAIVSKCCRTLPAVVSFLLGGCREGAALPASPALADPLDRAEGGLAALLDAVGGGAVLLHHGFAFPGEAHPALAGHPVADEVNGTHNEYLCPLLFLAAS